MSVIICCLVIYFIVKKVGSNNSVTKVITVNEDGQPVHRVGEASIWNGGERFTYLVSEDTSSGDKVKLTTLDGGYRMTESGSRHRVTTIYNVRYEKFLPCPLDRMCWAEKVS